jgi:probable HAF family extracellular repeat protein
VNQYLQFEAVVWGPRKNEIQQLPPFPGDPDGAATGINDSGQVIGISGICQNAVGNQSAAHALLWQNGAPTNLGSLGGTAWNTPMAINSRGDIVGFSDLTGDDNGANPNFHAFLWIQPGPMQDLNTLAGDAISEALGINSQRQVVGTSIDADGNEHAFIWQNGQLTNLNSLVQENSPLYLQAAQEINDSGVIVGQGCVPGNCLPTSPSLAFVAIPTYDGNEDEIPVIAAGNKSQNVGLSDSVRQQILQRGAFGRIGVKTAGQ